MVHQHTAWAAHRRVNDVEVQAMIEGQQQTERNVNRSDAHCNRPALQLCLIMLLHRQHYIRKDSTDLQQRNRNYKACMNFGCMIARLAADRKQAAEHSAAQAIAEHCIQIAPKKMAAPSKSKKCAAAEAKEATDPLAADEPAVKVFYRAAFHVRKPIDQTIICQKINHHIKSNNIVQAEEEGRSGAHLCSSFCHRHRCCCPLLNQTLHQLGSVLGRSSTPPVGM